MHLLCITQIIYCLGQVGITLNTDWEAPKNPMDPADWDAAERGEQFHLGWFANPIFGDGDYPQVMRSTIDERSREQGLSMSRLPTFSPDDMRIIKGKKTTPKTNLGLTRKCHKHR